MLARITITAIQRLRSRISAESPKIYSTLNVPKNNDTLGVSKIRNIGIIAHIDAGKTTLTERMLLQVGYFSKPGSVDNGTTVTDFLAAERERGITIQSACIPLHWKDYCFNLIDTPGHVDFTIEVERSLVVLDGAVCVIDGVSGVEAQTETVWEQANRYHLPRIVFINKMDREGSKVRTAIKSISSRLTGAGTPLLLQWPIVKQEGGFLNREGRGGQQLYGIVNLVTMDFVRADDTKISSDEATAVAGPELTGDIAKLYSEMLEKLADADEQFLNELLEVDMDYSKVFPAQIKAAIARATASKLVVPVLLGSAFRNVGVASLLEAVADYLPPPQPAKAISNSKAAIAYAFKVTHDTRRAPLVFLRVYQGTFKPKTQVVNVNNGKKERIHRLVNIYADEYRDVSAATLGSIIAAYGFHTTKTGDTIALLPTSHTHIPEKLCPIPIPPPVFICGVEPSSRSEIKSLHAAMKMLLLEDPSLHFSQDPETEQFLLSGMGELHLQIVQERLRELGVQCTFGPVRIHYRESVNFNGLDELEEKFVMDQIIDGKRVKINMLMSIAPLADSSSGLLENDTNTVEIALNESEIVHSSSDTAENSNSAPVMRLSGEFPSFDDIKTTLDSSIASYLSKAGGPLVHAPLSNLKVKVKQLKLYSGDTCSLHFISDVATRLLKRLVRMGVSSEYAEALKYDAFDGSRVQSVLLEPLMGVTITIPSTYIGNVTQDLSGQRRGSILDVEDIEADAAVKRTKIAASVPLSQMLGYSTHLRSLTGGSGAFLMQFKGYMSLPTQETLTVIQANSINDTKDIKN